MIDSENEFESKFIMAVRRFGAASPNDGPGVSAARRSSPETSADGRVRHPGQPAGCLGAGQLHSAELNGADLRLRAAGPGMID
jgi:hypothetical protein